MPRARQAMLATVLFWLPAAILVRAQLTIDIPSTVQQCDPVVVRWQGGQAPFTLQAQARFLGSQADHVTLYTISGIMSNDYTWIVTADASKDVLIFFDLQDSTGVEAETDAVPLRPGILRFECMHELIAATGYNATEWANSYPANSKPFHSSVKFKRHFHIVNPELSVAPSPIHIFETASATTATNVVSTTAFSARSDADTTLSVALLSNILLAFIFICYSNRPFGVLADWYFDLEYFSGSVPLRYTPASRRTLSRLRRRFSKSAYSGDHPGSDIQLVMKTGQTQAPGSAIVSAGLPGHVIPATPSGSSMNNLSPFGGRITTVDDKTILSYAHTSGSSTPNSRTTTHYPPSLAMPQSPARLRAAGPPPRVPHDEYRSAHTAPPSAYALGATPLKRSSTIRTGASALSTAPLERQVAVLQAQLDRMRQEQQVPTSPDPTTLALMREVASLRVEIEEIRQQDRDTESLPGYSSIYEAGGSSRV